MKKKSMVAAVASFVPMMLMPMMAHAAFDQLCDAYNQYFAANSKLIGFGLSIMIVVSLIAYFTSEEKRGIISVAASILIVAVVAINFPAILGAVGINTCN